MVDEHPKTDTFAIVLQESMAKFLIGGNVRAVINDPITQRFYAFNVLPGKSAPGLIHRGPILLCLPVESHMERCAVRTYRAITGWKMSNRESHPDSVSGKSCYNGQNSFFPILIDQAQASECIRLGERGILLLDGVAGLPHRELKERFHPLRHEPGCLTEDGFDWLKQRI
jgi:hypothetical protein